MPLCLKLLAHNGRSHQQSLLLLGIGLQKLYLLANVPLGVAFLGDAPLVFAYDRISGVYNSLGRAVVALQTEYFRLGIVLLEVQYVFDP